MKASQKADKLVATTLKIAREYEKQKNLANEEDSDSSESQSSSNCDAASRKWLIWTLALHGKKQSRVKLDK